MFGCQCAAVNPTGQKCIETHVHIDAMLCRRDPLAATLFGNLSIRSSITPARRAVMIILQFEHCPGGGYGI